jgi:integrase
LPAIRVHDPRQTWRRSRWVPVCTRKIGQERLGHSSIGVTLDIYSHVVPAMDTDAADRVGCADSLGPT